MSKLQEIHIEMYLELFKVQSHVSQMRDMIRNAQINCDHEALTKIIRIQLWDILNELATIRAAAEQKHSRTVEAIDLIVEEVSELVRMTVLQYPLQTVKQLDGSIVIHAPAEWWYVIGNRVSTVCRDMVLMAPLASLSTHVQKKASIMLYNILLRIGPHISVLGREVVNVKDSDLKEFRKRLEIEVAEAVGILSEKMVQEITLY